MKCVTCHYNKNTINKGI